MLLVAGLLFVTPWVIADVIALLLLGLTYGLQGLRRIPEVAPAPAAPLD
jgi:hypothetical protein